MSNPNLNEVLQTNEKLFYNAWVQLHNTQCQQGALVIALENYSEATEPKTCKDIRKLYSLISKNKQKLLNMYKRDYIEINDYLSID